ncbi:MAG: phosphoglycolate phosphatase [Fluviicoccus sp.]|uniref:phosphoglycolate phosphatase n=1 Tax=Fluviicoccus sp. TaxID=2003552 RepID=UPI002725BFDA|nr:phosphoglycolate phosphatase [Fluviicoccus sp.]MDO8331334.1 phosphoglycolate phosphatase [Fluviicoccus sp.]
MFSLIGFTPRLIMCDLDGTLVDSASDIHHCLNLALEDLGLAQVSQQQVRNWVGRGASRLVYCVLEAGHHAPGLHDELLAGFMRHYQLAVCQFSRFYDGVPEFLKACRQAGIPLACVTNKPYAPAKALLEALDCLGDFRLLVGGDTLPHKKPHPEPLLHCLRHFEVRPGEALMLGDSRNDVEAARAAGVPCVALPYGYNHGEPIEACEPTWIIPHLGVLLDAAPS